MITEESYTVIFHVWQQHHVHLPCQWFLLFFFFFKFFLLYLGLNLEPTL
jgi:hypothetical protein